MRGALAGSSLFHLGLLVAIFIVPKSSAIIVPGPEVVQVSLTDPTTMMSQAPPPPPKEPEAKVETIKPTEEEGVKLEPPKPPKQQKKPVEKQETPPPRTQNAALPYAPVGNAGLRGQISLDASDFEFTYYLMLVRNRIAQNWAPPAGMVTSGRPVHAVVYFRIARDGELSAIRVEEGSNAEFFDRSAIRAVTISTPMPQLPLGYPGRDLGVHFGFEYSPP